MIIQFNTDNVVSGSEKRQTYFSDQITQELDRFEAHITRIEVHLSDENGKKKGFKDIRCLMEARLEGRKPIAVSCQESELETAVSGAIDKLKASLDSIIGRSTKH